MWQSKFRDVVDLTGNIFKVANSSAARRQLAMHVNDNVYKNIEKFSVRSFDEAQKFSKEALSMPERQIIVKDLVDDADAKEQLNEAVDRILIAHRNTKLFLFLMSGPFFLGLSAIKYAIKISLFYFFFKKSAKSLTHHDS